MTEPITTPPIATAPVPPLAPVAAVAPVAAPAPTPAAAAAPVPVPADLAPIPTVSDSTAILNLDNSGSDTGSGVGGFKIPDEDFNKPLLIRILRVERRSSKYEPEPFLAPVVDYLVLDPATGAFEERKNYILTQKLIRKDLAEKSTLSAYHAAIATFKDVGKSNPAKVLKGLTDQNCGGYTAAQAIEHLTAAAKSLGWNVA